MDLNSIFLSIKISYIRLKRILVYFLKVFTPFISASVSAINGVLMYLKIECEIEIDSNLFTSLDHSVGSSILFVSYVLARSPHMCKYYKASCYSLLIFNIYAEVYIHTKMAFNWFAYISITLLMASIVFWTIYALGAKTRRFIRQFYRYGQK